MPAWMIKRGRYDGLRPVPETECGGAPKTLIWWDRKGFYINAQPDVVLEHEATDEEVAAMIQERERG